MTPRLEPVPFAVAPRATSPLEKLRIAIVHYWFVSHRGGERVVEAIAEMFPQADLFSPVVNSELLPKTLRRRAITTSFLQSLPGSTHWHGKLLPLYPLALEQFDLSGYDLVLSSESGPAKGVLTSAGTCHVCYCHSPMRYLWDFYHQYKNRSVAFWSRPVFTCVSHYMRLWDAASANRVDYFVANSRNIAARIRKARHQAERHRIAAHAEHDRDRCSGCLGGASGGSAGGRRNHGNTALDCIFKNLMYFLVTAVEPVVLDKDILPFNKACLGQTFAEFVGESSTGVSPSAINHRNDWHRYRRHLRAGAQPWCNCRAAEKRDELAPPHGLPLPVE